MNNYFASSASRRLDYIYAEGSIVAVHVIEDGIGSVYYVFSDHLGSWEKVLDWNRRIVQQTHFDPWGNRMSYTAWNTPQTQTSFTFDRGFTGHEHYDCMHIINANARLYDPVIGRFFSPDPFVQAPDFTQNFNRYSYCMNNPVMYSDPKGKYFVLDSWIAGFVSKMVETGSWKQSWNEANKRAWNDIKISVGLLLPDDNKNFWGRSWEVFSRFTWQAPQTAIGWTVAETCNTWGLAGGVESVNYKYGATVTRTNNGGWGAVTLGNYITGDHNIQAVADNPLFQHEYGHYIQSQATGIFYLPRYGIPSGLNCLGANEHRHKDHPVEQDANIRAFKYFKKHIEGFYKWYYDLHPIDNYEWTLPYTDEDNQNALKKGKLQPAWYDYFLLHDPIIDGLINWLVLENY